MDTKKNSQCISHDENQNTQKQWWNLIKKIHKINNKRIMQNDLLNWINKRY